MATIHTFMIPHPWWRWSYLALVAAILLAAWLVSLWPPLQQARWWYPEAGFRELWTLTWVGLYGFSLWWRKKHGSLGRTLQILWILVLVLAFSSWFNLLQYIHHFFTTGDLHYNHFRGAQRAYQGLPVYDVRGLQQSVNASPFVIAGLRPFGWMTTRNFLPWWLLCQSILLFFYFVYAWRWLHWLWQGLPTQNHPPSTSPNSASPGLPEVGILVITTLFFNSFQRSWRLGQLDILLLFLIAAGSFHLCWYILRPSSRYHGMFGGLLVTMAVGVKLVPILLLVPLCLWFLLHRETARRVVPTLVWSMTVSSLVVVGVSWWGVGHREISRFIQNFRPMAQGSTAGVNYALVSRFAKYRDVRLRQRNQPIPPQDRRWLWPLRVLIGVLWFAAVWGMTMSHLPFLLMLGLASLPLISPMCWDIYFLWCANFPWFLLWGWLTRDSFAFSPHCNHSTRTLASPRTQRWLVYAVLGGSFYLMGLSGNSVIRDIHSMKLLDLHLPLWFDEARILGYLLLIGLLLWVLFSPTPQNPRSAVPEIVKL